MEKKGRISLLSLVVIVIVVLLVGIGAGYFITNNLYFDYLNKKQTAETKEMSTSKVNMSSGMENKVDSRSTSVNVPSVSENKIDSNVEQEISQYDGSKSITVNGKNYTVGFLNEVKSTDSEENCSVTFSLNDKKIKRIEYCKKFSMDDIELSTIRGDKEYIVISIKPRKIIDSDTYLMIVNQDEELITTIPVAKSNVGISIDGINCYKIFEDSVMFYKAVSPKTKNGNSYVAAVYRVKVENNEAKYDLERLCTSDEVVFSGK